MVSLYKATLAVTGAIKRSSREKIYQELGLEHLHARHWILQSDG